MLSSPPPTVQTTKRARQLLVCTALAAALWPAAPGRGEEVAVPAAYAPYAFLIGTWDIGPEGAPPAAVTRFRWGPKKTYIWYSGALLVDGGERASYEGLLIWNGVRHDLDMLLAQDQSTGSLVQEQGIVSVEPDGSVVRDITVVYSEGNALPPDWTRPAPPEGATAHFRHRFEPVGPGRVRTSIWRESDEGWVPSFPGSDALVMVRRPAD